MSRRAFLRRAAPAALAPCFAPVAAQEARDAFGARSTGEEVTEGLDLGGRTVLITGCNSGLGYETMRVLALRGAHVLGTARSARKARRACESVQGETTPLVLELTDFDSIVECAEQVRAMSFPLDVLICNAGVMLPAVEHVNGIEKHFVVNHLGHFILARRLLDPLLASPQGRVVVVSSVAHWFAPPEGIRFDELSGRADYDAAEAYGQSKLANGLFAMELARRLEGTTVTSNALHPGIVDTNLHRHASTTVSGGAGRKRVEEGAATTCYVATHPGLAEVSGRYFEDCAPAEPSALMRDEALAEELWTVSEELAEE